MSVLTDVKSRVSGLARAEKERYSGGEERPLGGYLAAMGAYAAVTATLAAATRLTRREVPDGLAVRDVLLSAVATHRARKGRPSWKKRYGERAPARQWGSSSRARSALTCGSRPG